MQRSLKTAASLHLDAQPWDIFQYDEQAVRKVHDGQVRCAVYFRGSLDPERLKEAVKLSFGAIPQLCSRYVLGEKQPYWQPENVADGKLFTSVETNCTDDEVESFLAGRTDCLRGPQIRLRLVRGQARDTLCILVNRMVFDEGALREYLYLLAKIYTAPHSLAFHIPHPEKLFMRRVRHMLPPFARFRAAFRRNEPVRFGTPKKTFPFSGRAETPFLVTSALPVSRYKAIAHYAFSHRVKVEEVLLTAYARAIFAMLSERPGAPFSVACKADLRQFLAWGSDHALCSLALPVLLVLPPALPRTFYETLLLVHSRFSKIQGLAAVVENANLLGLYPFSIKKTMERHLSVSLPVCHFTYVGKLEPSRLQFADVEVNDAFITGPIYNQPQIGVCATVYEDSLTLSCNLRGTRDDWATCKYFMAMFVRELPSGR